LEIRLKKVIDKAIENYLSVAEMISRSARVITLFSLSTILNKNGFDIDALTFIFFLFNQKL
jgi:hypothetical protein